jgi:raffinose/stachyose/melibiose transport system substrate-binding protein
MKKAVTFIILVCFSISFVMTGCGNTANSTETTAAATTAQVESSSAPAETTAAAPQISGKLTALNHFTGMIDDLKKISDAFNAKYPDASITFETLSDWATVEKVRLASGSAPDILEADFTVVTTSDQLGNFFLPVDDLGYTKDTINFYDMYSYESKHYAIVDSIMLPGLLYSKKTMSGVGITEAPKTLDELYSDCDKLKAKGIVPMGSMVKDLWPLSNWCVVRNAYETANTAKDYYAPYTGSDAPFIKDSPYGKELAFIKAIRDKGYFDPNPASSSWDVLRLKMDKTGFLMLANYGLSGLVNEKPEDVGFCPLPIDNSGKTYSSAMAGTAYAIYKNTKSPDAAKAFIKFWLEDSHFNDLEGMAPSIKGQKSGIPQIADFLAVNPVIFEEPAPTNEFSKIINKAQMDQRLDQVLQEVIVNGDIDAALAKYNKIWADARKAVAN